MKHREKMYELAQRCNVIHREWNGKSIIIYDDHRWLLNVLFFLRKNDMLTKPNIVFFDAHDDSAQCGRRKQLLEKIGVTTLDDATYKQFLSFVDYDTRIDDGGWVTTACELDLVGDVVCIGNRNNNNIDSLQNGIYKSEDGMQHCLSELSEDLEYEIGSRGALGDSTKAYECKAIREFFNSGETYYEGVGKMKPFILDFDLDFFTLEIKNGSNIAWSPKTFESRFPAYGEIAQFMWHLLHDSELITICREPDCCGTLGNSNRILELLDMYWFEGAIGTSTNY